MGPVDGVGVAKVVIKSKSRHLEISRDRDISIKYHLTDASLCKRGLAPIIYQRCAAGLPRDPTAPLAAAAVAAAPKHS